MGGHCNGRIHKGERQNLRVATMSVQNRRTLRHKKSQSSVETSSAGLVGRINTREALYFLEFLLTRPGDFTHLATVTVWYSARVISL